MTPATNQNKGLGKRSHKTYTVEIYSINISAKTKFKYLQLCNMRTIGPAVSEKKIFEIVDDDGRTLDDGRTPEHGYTISECQTTRNQDDSDPKFLGRLGPKPFRTQDESDQNRFGPKTNRTHTDGRYTDDIINHAWYPPGPRGSRLQMT